MYYTTSKLYNELLGIYVDECYGLSDAERSKMNPKYDPTNLTLKDYNYDEWYTGESDYSKVKEDERLDDFKKKVKVMRN